MWSTNKNRKAYTKIDASVKQALYDWIIQHSHIVQYPIAKKIEKVSVYSHTDKKIVPNILFKLSAR